MSSWRIYLLLLLCALLWLPALRLGPREIQWQQILEALLAYDPSQDVHQALLFVRLPRVLLGGLVGAALAVSGAIMQGLTRNPLASPTLTGFNGGASLAVLLGLLAFPSLGLSAAMLLSFAGGLLGMALVFGVCAAAPGGLTPTRLALAGIMVSATLGGFTSGLINYYQLGFEMLYWTMGGLNAVQWSHVAGAGAIMLVGFAMAVPLAPQLDALRLGREVALGLGLRTRDLQIAGLAAATMLAGSAVAVAGPVTFVGLLGPHLARALVGGSYLRVLPLSAMLGSLAVVWADTLSRLYGQGYAPLGVYLSLFGSLFFLVLAARRREMQHA